MTLPAQGIAPSLPALGRDQLSWTRNAALALRAHGYEGRIMSADSGVEAFFLGDALAFAPAEGAPLRAAADDLVACLDAHEAILREIESAIGLAAEFGDHGPLPEALAVIALARGGQPIGRIAVRAPVAPPRHTASLTVLRPAFIAARLALAEAERLSPGDMLLLERGPWRLVDGLPAPGSGPLGYDPESGTIGPLIARPSADPATSTEPLDMTKPDEAAGLKVAVSLHLADIAVSTQDLAAMAERGTFDLGAVSEGLAATLSIGGRTIGRGEIVRLGDRFAVLLDGSQEGDPPPPDAEADETTPTDQTQPSPAGSHTA